MRPQRALQTIISAFFSLAAAWAGASDLTIYDDALENSFQDYSYGGGDDFANTTPVHGGTHSISLAGNDYNAISFFHAAGALAFADHPTLRVWIHGGSAGGQALTLFLQNSPAGTFASVALDGYIEGGAPAAGTWREADVPLASITAFTALGSYDRIDIQSDADGTQPTVYFDDISLLAATPDSIFGNGFDGSGLPAKQGLVIDHDVAIDGLLGDRFSWRDSANQPRVAVLAHNDGGSGNDGTHGGELRELDYQVGAAMRSVRATDDGFGGFGYVVSHPYDEDSHCTGGGDSSSLGHFTPGHFQRLFEGRHHAIFRFTQNYPRYCTANAPTQEYDLPVTIDWVFASGRDHPLWAITYDVSAVPVDRLEDDSRAPYGQMRIDGADSDDARSAIAGVAWGDYYAFSSTVDPVTFSSGWSWNRPNTIPYVALWTSAVDATMGIVQTQTIQQQDAGGYWGQDLWNQTSADLDGCAGNYAMPCDYDWPFQSINYEIGVGTPTQNARLAWGTNFGFLGQQQYRIRGNAEYGGSGNGTALPGDPMAAGWPKKSYSTYIVLGTHSSDPVGAQVGEVETRQSLVLSATVGAVATQGTAGIADSTPTTLQPPGYDAVYGALAFTAAGNHLDGNIAVGSGTLHQPLLIVRGYGAGLPSSVRLNGATLVQDADYFPSVRSDAAELWLTLNRSLGGAANRIEITP